MRKTKSRSDKTKSDKMIAVRDPAEIAGSFFIGIFYFSYNITIYCDKGVLKPQWMTKTVMILK